MKKSLIMITASILVAFGMSAVASAQTKTPGVNKRQKTQQKRIYHGVKNGNITGKEFKVLQKRQIKTQKAKKRAKADGQVTRKERVKLHKRLKNNSRKIYRANHNKRKPRL